MNTNEVLNKLKAEIEKLLARANRRTDKEHLSHNSEMEKFGEDYWNGYGDFAYGLLGYIHSLQQEQPDNEDIDKVAQELYEHLYELKRRNNVPTNLYDKQEIIDLWKAGIEYGRNHPKQEQPEVDFEKEYKSYMESRKDDFSGNAVTINMKDLARHFYELGLNARKV